MSDVKVSKDKPKQVFKARIDVNAMLPHITIPLTESIDAFNVHQVLEQADYSAASDWVRSIVLENSDALMLHLMQRRRAGSPVLEAVEFRMEQERFDVESELYFKGRNGAAITPANPTLTAKQGMQLLVAMHEGTAPDVLADIDSGRFYVRHQLELRRRGDLVDEPFVYAKSPQEAVVLLISAIFDFLRSHSDNTIIGNGEIAYDLREFHAFTVNVLDLKALPKKKETA